MTLLFALMFITTLQQEVKFKPSEEFDLKVDYNFRTRPVPANYSINFEKGRQYAGPLPFVSITLKVLKAHPEEERLRMVDNYGEVVLNKRIREGMELTFDLGFTADMKDRVGPHEYAIYFQGANRKDVVSQILIHVAEDGTFLVNEEVRGKF